MSWQTSPHTVRNFLHFYTYDHVTPLPVPLKFDDAHTILFQMAKHDTQAEVQYACLQSLNQLAKQCKDSTHTLNRYVPQAPILSILFNSHNHNT
jgi:hypothetical protein